jgi:O-antigen ligase
MKQIFLLICILPFAAIPALILLQIKSDMRNYYLLISIFMNQLALVFFIGVNPQGVYEGASIFVNLSIIYTSAVPLLVLLLTRPTRMLHSEKKPSAISSELLKWSWVAIYLFGVYSSILATTKLLPMACTFIFGVVLYLVIEGDFNFEMILTAVYKFFGTVATFLNLSFIFRFDWSRYVVQTEDILNADSTTYFSPIAAILDLPTRMAGPFASSQVTGMFSVFGIACYLSSKDADKKKFFLFTLIVFGSFSGSRTFYLTLICLIVYHLIKNFLPQETIAFWIFLFFGFAVTAALVYKFILPIISPNSSTLTNLTGRTKLWELILKNWSSDGFFGHGPESLTQYSLERLYFPFAHAHNSFLQFLWDFGIPGISVIISMILFLCVAASKNPADRSQVVGLILILLLIQTEPTIRVGTQVTGWFWLVPLSYVYSRSREIKINHHLK